MQYQPLGNTGYQVSRFCFGTLTLGPIGAQLPLDKGVALLRQAADLGINFFDTAQLYANYDYLAAAFADRPEIIIASKSFADTYDEMAWAVEEARIGLRRDKIDIFLMHEQRDAEAIRENWGAMEYLLAAKANGIIGAVGISTHNVSAAQAAAEMPEIEVLHCIFNYQGVGVLGGTIDDMRKAMEAARTNGKGVYGMKALGGGALMSEARKAMTWAYAQDCQDSLAIGMKDEAELLTNFAWLHGQEAPQAEQVKLLDRNLAFEEEPTCRKCGKCLERCAQQALYYEEYSVGWHKDRCLYCGYCIAACPWFCISFC